MPKASLAARLHVPAVAVAIGLLSGCSYTSRYVPPPDGRARAVWEENHVAMDVAGQLPRECRAAVRQVASGSRPLVVERGAEEAAAGAYWAPRYFGPPIMVVTPGFAPHLMLRPLFAPRIHFSRGLRHGIGARGPAGPLVNTGGGGNDLGKAAAVLAVVALIVLPVVDVALALSNPENVKASQWGMSQVAAYNDLSRQPGSPCAYAEPAPVVPGGAP